MIGQDGLGTRWEITSFSVPTEFWVEEGEHCSSLSSPQAPGGRGSVGERSDRDVLGRWRDY